MAEDLAELLCVVERVDHGAVVVAGDVKEVCDAVDSAYADIFFGDFDYG